MLPLVSVVVVTWDGRDRLVRCLEALDRQQFRDFETLVVDNGSSDGSAELVAERWPAARLIVAPNNVGFAMGNNLAFDLAKGELVATLNNDAYAEPEWLGALVVELERAPAAGAVASRIVLASGPERLDSAGIEVDRLGTAHNRLLGQPVAMAEEATVVFGASAAAALYRRAAVDRVGLFDEDFVSYYEDVDLAWRLRLAGWECRCAPAAIVRHEHSATGRTGSPLKEYLIGRNRIWSIAQSYPAPELWWWLPMIVGYDAITLAGKSALTRGSAPLRGRLAALRGLGRSIGKRRRFYRERATAAGIADVRRWLGAGQIPSVGGQLGAWRELVRA